MSFDVLAPHYRWMELVLAGTKLQQCRTTFLREIPEPKSVLLCGEGNGRFLTECRKAYPNADITCVDLSQRMLDIARTKVQKIGTHSSLTRFIHADILSWNPPVGVFDLIVTHFFLDCFRAEQLEAVVQRLAAGSRRGAAWLLADFQAPQRGAPRYRARVILRLMYAFFSLVTNLPARDLTSADHFLRQNRFNLRARRTIDWGLLRTDWWELV